LFGGLLDASSIKMKPLQKMQPELNYICCINL